MTPAVAIERPSMKDNNDQQAPTGAVQRWADGAMYRAERMPTEGLTVRLLNATPDPLGSVAAICGIYKGEVVRDLATITNEQRRQVLDDMMKTELNSPLEAAQFHFLIEGVSRAFVDQMTRGRNAFYAVESLRFAVKEDWAAEVPAPPSLAGLREDDPRLSIWRKAMNQTEDAYAALVAAGVPAEDARSLLPMGIATRAHWVVTLRELLHVAGLRLCTQAQFEWRLVMTKVAQALRGYSTVDEDYAVGSDSWQFRHLADMLRPVCYAQGKCGFMASFDRDCTIRERVEAFGSVGVPSSKWHENYDPEGAYTDGPPRQGQIGGPHYIRRIQPQEWLADHTAARRGGDR